jgi:aquaporin Z
VRHPHAPPPFVPARGPALWTELVGTGLLTVVIAMCVLAGVSGPTVAAAVFAVLLAIVYAGGPVSRAMYNPAVSCGFAVRGILPWRDVTPFVAVQLAGALVAVAAAWVMVPAGREAVSVGAGDVTIAALVAEVVFTFALMWVILHVADLRHAPDNAWYGIAIAGVVAAAILAAGPVSGAVLNPAVAIAAGIIGARSWAQVAAYIPAELMGAVLAALVARTTAASAALVPTPD